MGEAGLYCSGEAMELRGGKVWRCQRRVTTGAGP